MRLCLLLALVSGVLTSACANAPGNQLVTCAQQGAGAGGCGDGRDQARPISPSPATHVLTALAIERVTGRRAEVELPTDPPAN